VKRAFAVLCLVLAVAACDEPDKDVIYGYAEGRFRLLAPDSEGRIVEVMVEQGDTIAAGAVIAQLDTSIEEAELDRAKAEVAAAESRLLDALAGGREPEIRAAQQVLAQAEAAAREAHAELDRVQPLFETGDVPRSRLDSAEADVRAADARVAELRERLTVVELPARENVVAALKHDVEAAKAAESAAEDALAKRTVIAPEAGLIERLLREAGETAGPSAPIVRYLPDGAMMAIGFIPEDQLGSFAPGDRLAVSCDSCPQDLTAVVTSISEQAAFTSPTIFSDKERARLVFRLEARFEGEAPPSGTPLRLTRLP